MQLAGLYIYPVKSLRGFAVESAVVDALGLCGDRRFLVIDANGRMLTQREVPRMALVATQLTPTHLVLGAAGASQLEIPLRPSQPGEPVTVTVWKSTGLQAEDCGTGPAAWLTAQLGLACRLLRIGAQFRRPVPNPQRASAHDFVSFADGYPFLVLSEASVAHLNDRLTAAGETAVPINRFRPNLVLRDCTAFAEDTWARFKIGDVTFRTGGPCSRCIITTTDQTTGVRGKEPLHTLAGYRRDAERPGAINFGQNLIHETKTGLIRVGDTVELLCDGSAA